MPRYRYESAHEWFEELLHRTGRDEGASGLEGIARALASQLDADALQDLFEEEMEEDGYFDDLDAAGCLGCANTFNKSEMHLRDDEWYCTDCALELQDEDEEHEN